MQQHVRRTLGGVLLAALLPLPAQAGTRATVIERPGRSVAVVALAGGALARVRLPRGVQPAVGRRVVLHGRRDTVGTFVARTVRPLGAAGRFRLTGIVVGRDGDVVLVASGAAVARLTVVPAPAIGTAIQAVVRLDGAVARASTARRVAAPTRLRLAGVVSAIGADVLALRLPGGANIAVGSGGRDVSWLKAGDPVVLDVRRRGARLTLRRYARLEGRDAFRTPARGDVVGQVGSVDTLHLTILRPGRPATVLELPAPATAAGARNGDTVLADRRSPGDVIAAHVIVLGRAVPAAPPALEVRSAPPATTAATTVVVEWTARGVVDRQLCSLDGAAWAACASPLVRRDLQAGPHVVGIVAGNAAGWTPRTDVRFTVDPPPPAAPVVTITGGAPAVGYATSASFPFTVQGATSTLCSLDGAPWVACSSPRSVTALAVGDHVFSVTAGNAGGWTLASRTFTVLALPAAPTVALTEQPSASTSATSALLGWTTTGTVDATTCRLDAGAFTACSSPLALNGLGLGSHTVTVRATNAGGTGQAVATWTIVAPPPGAPTLTITSAPTGSTTATTASIGFTTSGTGVTVTCALDAGAAVSCASPAGYTGLALGAHTVTIVAANGGGTATATAAWTVVPAPPGITLTGAPSGTVTSPDATLTWTTTGAVATTTCSLDGGVFAPCSSPASFTGLGTGPHSVVVRVANAGGTTDATATWTITVGAPTVAISSAPPATTTATTATIAWVTTGTVTSTTCSLDGGTFAACTSPAVLTGLALGAHTYAIKVANAGGYATAAAGWSVGAAPPPPPPPTNTALPVISGTAQSRKTLTATPGTWSGAPDTYVFQWLRCTSATSVASCTAIAGASAASYTAATADIDTYLRVQVDGIQRGRRHHRRVRGDAQDDAVVTPARSPMRGGRRP